MMDREVLESAVDDINQAAKHDAYGKDVEAIPLLLDDAIAKLERAKEQAESDEVSRR